MKQIDEILANLHNSDVTREKLRTLASQDPQDEIFQLNIEAIAKRRQDLERRLGDELRDTQSDLIRYRIEEGEGGISPLRGIGLALALFQEIVTSVFDAIRTLPKRTYDPSAENVELSTMTFASARTGSIVVSMAVPNERLLAIKSDLDVALELVFGLLQARTRAEFKKIGARVGIAPISKTYLWASNSVEHGLSTFISWQKAVEWGQSISVSGSEALQLQTAINSTNMQQVDHIEEDCELLSLNDIAPFFLLRTARGQQIDGGLSDEFPRGRNWVTYGRYTAGLTRAVRIRCATGEETTRWTLRKLTPQR